MTTWHDELPPGWELKRLRRVAQLNPSKREVGEIDRDAEVSFIPMEAVGEDGSVQLDRTRPIAEIETGYTYFREGDVTFAKITPCFENGKGAIMRGLIGGFGFGTTELTVLRPDRSMTTPEFLYRWLSSSAFRGPAEGAMYGAGGQKRVPDEFVRDFLAAFPPLPEQQAIAAFLDGETAKIDALVEEQKRLIDLLIAKRQTVISNAVTKGLNPDAPMSDTGIEWLGKVPTHWEVAPLKRYWSVTDCKHVTAEFVDEGYPLASIRECQRRFVDLSAAKQTTDEFYQVLVEGGRIPQSGDLIFTRNATVGRVSQVADWHPPFAMGQDVCLLRRNDDLQSADYLQSALEAKSTVQQLEVLMIGSTFKRVNVEEIRNLLIAFAPAAEQGEISSYLQHQTAKFDELISTAESTVLLLQERRAALISAAVTGKIDVRGQSTATVVTPDFRQCRKLVATKIVEDLAGHKTFGRVKLQKLLYLAEAHSGIHELRGHYVREAAGPLDRDMVRDVETDLQASGHVVIEQPEGRGTAVNYQLRGTRGAFETELQTLLGDRISALSELIEKVGALDTRGAEAVATLYAVWNDALASGTVPSDDEIIREVLNDWHPKKAETFTVADLKHWLAWMRRNGLTPKGNAPVTSTGRLFV